MPTHPFEEQLAALDALVKEGPGFNPGAMKRVGLVLDTITRRNERAPADVREKAAGARESFEAWFSARRWSEGGDGGARARDYLIEDIRSLDMALAAAHGAQ